jgi:hypothetical protein
MQGHPRILLNPKRLASLRGLYAARAPSWRNLAALCDDAAKSSIDAGYEAWDWANVTLALALCHQVTGNPAYASAGLEYFQALLDDRHRVGDRAGGDLVVRHDDGYSIRTHGCFAAIAYDWLHDAPGMTAELRKHTVDRMVTWSQWFAENGYNHDEPISNYYVGYFGTLAFGGIAADGDDPRAASLRQHAERMFRSEIAPAFSSKLRGGDFPEGWQYGDLVGFVLAAYQDAAMRAPATTPLPDLSWLRSTLDYRTHALWPDAKHTFDTGDWSTKPAIAPAHTLLTLGTVLPQREEASRRARALAHLAADPHEEWPWLSAIADDPSAPSEDPRKGVPSYLAPGTGSVLARSDWSPGAVWVALTCAPSLSDHQHLDAGHFEIVRGGDPLIVDPGGYGSFSSLSHNVIAVDDDRRNDVYAPNQGVWSDGAKIARFEDEGPFVYALAEYTSAYNPPGYPNDHPDRSVLEAEREFVYSRSPVGCALTQSGRVIIYDRMTLARPAFRATLLLHGGSDPQKMGTSSVRFRNGSSEATATFLLPLGAEPVFVREPTNLGDGAFYANDPVENTASTRVEVRSPIGDGMRRFLSVVLVGAHAPQPPCRKPDLPSGPILVRGEGVDGAVFDGEGYVFRRESADSKSATPLVWTVPPSVGREIVTSLTPGKAYAVMVDREEAACRTTVAVSDRGRRPSAAGVLVLNLAPGCVLGP